MKLRSIVVLLTLPAAVACSEPLEFADWTIPVSAGTPIIEHPRVSIDEREGKRIELVRDLVIGPRGDDPNYLFYFDDAWRALAVDDDGRVYVGDGGNYRVQVFDPQGRYLRTLGRPGPGPGEFQYPPFLIAVAGERMIVSYSRRPRLEEWSRSGEFLLRREVGGPREFLQLSGTGSGDFLASYALRYADDPWRRIVRIARLARLESPELEYLQQVDPRMPEEAWPGPLSLFRPLMKLGMYRPSFAVTRDGNVYLTGGGEYQVLASSATGESRWAMRVPWQRRQPTKQEQQGFVDQLLQTDDWPRNRDYVGALGPWPALSTLRVDGHGHLYVFPTVTQFPGTSSELPVDVYSAEGERLFAGFLPVSATSITSLSMLLASPLLPTQDPWLAALGDYVYTIEEDDRGEGSVVRYRLVEPFE